MRKWKIVSRNRYQQREREGERERETSRWHDKVTSIIKKVEDFGKETLLPVREREKQ